MSTQNLVFKIFMALVLLVVVYYAYQEVKRLVMEKRAAKIAQDIGEQVFDTVKSGEKDTTDVTEKTFDGS